MLKRGREGVEIAAADGEEKESEDEWDDNGEDDEVAAASVA